MEKVIYKGFPVTFEAYHQPTEPEVGIQEHYQIEEVLMCGIDPYELLGDDGFNELVEYIIDALVNYKTQYHG
jgi:hypothetical protein